MKVVSLIVCAFLSGEVYSQKIDAITLPDLDWCAGSIMLTSNKELKGFIRYNEITDELLFDSILSETLTPRSVLAFEYFDLSQKKQRLFYSLEHLKGMGHGFFEVLKDYTDFALLAKRDPIIKQTTEHNGTVGPYSNTYSPPRTTSKISQMETIYLVDFEAYKLYSLVFIIDTGIYGTAFDRTKREVKTVGLKEIKSLFGDKYKHVINYAKDEKLALEKKDDIVKIFDYFLSIR